MAKNNRMIGAKIYTYGHQDPGEYSRPKKSMKQVERREWVKDMKNEILPILTDEEEIERWQKYISEVSHKATLEAEKMGIDPDGGDLDFIDPKPVEKP